LVELLKFVSAIKNKKPTKLKPKAAIQKQLLLCSTILEGPWTLLLSCGFYFSKLVEIESYFITVSREIERDMFYTCFSQTTYSFSKVHSSQQPFHSS
jgi:hypothetical protein